MAFDPVHNTLFVGNYAGQIAEVHIPRPVISAVVTDLPFAGYVQAFGDPVEGHLNDIARDGAALHGLMVSGGNLFGTAAVYYDANNTQTASHYRRSTNLRAPSFSGFASVWQPTNADVAAGVPTLATGYASGYVAPVPVAWQGLLGGAAISGQWGLPIITRESYGPAAIVWNPTDLGSRVAGVGLQVLHGPARDTRPVGWGRPHLGRGGHQRRPCAHRRHADRPLLRPQWHGHLLLRRRHRQSIAGRHD